MLCTKCLNEGVLNQVLGKEFYYCRTCKEEIFQKTSMDDESSGESLWQDTIGIHDSFWSLPPADRLKALIDWSAGNWAKVDKARLDTTGMDPVDVYNAIDQDLVDLKK